MQRVSSNSTLFLKFFIPTFWIVFFGAITMAAVFVRYEYVGDIPIGTFRIIMLSFYISGVLMMVFTLLRLKRVEMDQDFVYVTNYFKNYRYPYHNIEGIEISKFLFFKTASISLKTPGSFGRRMIFVPDLQRFRLALNKYPHIRSEVSIKGVKF